MSSSIFFGACACLGGDPCDLAGADPMALDMTINWPDGGTGPGTFVPAVGDSPPETWTIVQRKITQRKGLKIIPGTVGHPDGKSYSTSNYAQFKTVGGVQGSTRNIVAKDPAMLVEGFEQLNTEFDPAKPAVAPIPGGLSDRFFHPRGGVFTLANPAEPFGDRIYSYYLSIIPNKVLQGAHSKEWTDDQWPTAFGIVIYDRFGTEVPTSDLVTVRQPVYDASSNGQPQAHLRITRRIVNLKSRNFVASSITNYPAIVALVWPATVTYDGNLVTPLLPKGSQLRIVLSQTPLNCV